MEDNREIILIMNKNLDIMIKKYGNKHTIENFKGRTAYCDESPKRSGSGSIRHKDITPDSKRKVKHPQPMIFRRQWPCLHQRKTLYKKSILI